MDHNLSEEEIHAEVEAEIARLHSLSEEERMKELRSIYEEAEANRRRAEADESEQA